MQRGGERLNRPEFLPPRSLATVKLNYQVTGRQVSKRQEDLNFATGNIWMQNIARSLYSSLLLALGAEAGGQNPPTFKSMSHTNLRCWLAGPTPLQRISL